MRKQGLLVAAGYLALGSAGLHAAPLVYTDTHGDGVGSSNAARDIWSASLSNDGTNLTVTVDLNPAANVSTTSNTFDYAIGITSGPGAGGDTSANATTHGNAYHEDISIDSALGGMTDWVGIFPLANGVGTTAGYNTYVFNTTTSAWAASGQNVNTAALATAAGDSFTAQTGNTGNSQFTVVIPLANFTNLNLTTGSMFNFDIYSTGSTAPNTAYDSLVDPSPTQSPYVSNTAQFNDSAATGGLATYTVQQVPEPASAGLVALVAGGLVRRRRSGR